MANSQPTDRALEGDHFGPSSRTRSANARARSVTDITRSSSTISAMPIVDDTVLVSIATNAESTQSPSYDVDLQGLSLTSNSLAQQEVFGAENYDSESVESYHQISTTTASSTRARVHTYNVSGTTGCVTRVIDGQSRTASYHPSHSNFSASGTNHATATTTTTYSTGIRTVSHRDQQSQCYQQQPHTLQHPVDAVLGSDRVYYGRDSHQNGSHTGPYQQAMPSHTGPYQQAMPPQSQGPVQNEVIIGLMNNMNMFMQSMATQMTNQNQQRHSDSVTDNTRSVSIPSTLSFDGDGCWKTFVSRCQRFMEQHRIDTNSARVYYLSSMLTGKASNFFEKLQAKHAHYSYAQLLQEMDRRYDAGSVRQAAILRFNEAAQYEGERIEEYVDRLWELADQAFPGLSLEETERQVICRFGSGLHDKAAKVQCACMTQYIDIVYSVMPSSPLVKIMWVMHPHRFQSNR